MSRARRVCSGPSSLGASLRRGAEAGFASIVVLAATLAFEGRAESLVSARPVALFEDDPLRVRLGDLRFEAGFVLSSADADFGGFSGLLVAPDGGALVAVSDHGTIWHANLQHDGDRLTGVSDWHSVRLRPLPTDHARLDVEALAGEGENLVIALEQDDPLRQVVNDGSAASMRALGADGGLDEAGDAAGNGGIEALTELEDGALLALAEDIHDASGQLAAWVVGDERFERLAYAQDEGFAPTGADRLDGVIYVVERRFDLLEGGFVSRVMALDADQVGPQAPMRGRELARLSWPALGENFEGIAVRGGADGRTLIYLISDDNFLPIQRTLLLQFSLAPTA